MRKRPPACRNCGGTDVVPIVYGYPAFPREGTSLSNDYALGGCEPPPSGGPIFACKGCGYQFGENPDLDDWAEQRARAFFDSIGIRRSAGE